MSRYVLRWIITGLLAGGIFGLLFGRLLSTSAENPTLIWISWTLIMGLGGLMFFGLWGYATEQHKKVRRPDLFDD